MVRMSSYRLSVCFGFSQQGWYKYLSASLEEEAEA